MPVAFGFDSEPPQICCTLRPALADLLVDARVDHDVRGWNRTSGHVRAWIDLSDKPRCHRRVSLSRASRRSTIWGHARRARVSLHRHSRVPTAPRPGRPTSSPQPTATYEISAVRCDGVAGNADEVIVLDGIAPSRPLRPCEPRAIVVAPPRRPPGPDGLVPCRVPGPRSPSSNSLPSHLTPRAGCWAHRHDPALLTVREPAYPAACGRGGGIKRRYR